MDLSGEFVLARDVALIDGPLRCGRRLAGPTPPEVTVLDDRHTVRLLTRFRRPTTICDAILDTAAEVRRHPEEILDGCYPALRDLIATGFIVAAGTSDARPGREGRTEARSGREAGG